MYCLNLFYHKALNDITNIPCVIHLTGQIGIAYPASVHKGKSASIRCSRCNLPDGLSHLCRCCMIGEQDSLKTGCHSLLRHIYTIVIVRLYNHGNIVQLCCACHVLQVVMVKWGIFRQEFHIIIQLVAADDFNKLRPCKIDTGCDDYFFFL